MSSLVKSFIAKKAEIPDPSLEWSLVWWFVEAGCTGRAVETKPGRQEKWFKAARVPSMSPFTHFMKPYKIQMSYCKKALHDLLSMFMNCFNSFCHF